MGIDFHNPRAFAPFYSHPVAFHGMRPDERRVALTVKCQVVEDTFTEPGDTVAPMKERAFNITFPVAAWTIEIMPNVGDWVWFKWSTGGIWGKVSRVGYMPNGDFCLSVVHDPNEKGYPQWLG